MERSQLQKRRQQGFKGYTPPKTNGWRAPKWWALEMVIPALNMDIFGIYVKFLGIYMPKKQIQNRLKWWFPIVEIKGFQVPSCIFLDVFFWYYCPSIYCRINSPVGSFTHFFRFFWRKKSDSSVGQNRPFHIPRFVLWYTLLVRVYRRLLKTEWIEPLDTYSIITTQWKVYKIFVNHVLGPL